MQDYFRRWRIKWTQLGIQRDREEQKMHLAECHELRYLVRFYFKAWQCFIQIRKSDRQKLGMYLASLVLHIHGN